jgi:hypothetical protein
MFGMDAEKQKDGENSRCLLKRKICWKVKGQNSRVKAVNGN